MSVTSTKSGHHYRWGNNCDGWHLLSSPNLSVIQERMPGGSAEVRHLHHQAEQYFYILNGTATLEIDGVVHNPGPGEGVHVPAGTPHTMKNSDQSVLEFLVISTPPSHGDRELA